MNSCSDDCLPMCCSPKIPWAWLIPFEELRSFTHCAKGLNESRKHSREWPSKPFRGGRFEPSVLDVADGSLHPA